MLRANARLTEEGEPQEEGHGTHTLTLLAHARNRHVALGSESLVSGAGTAGVLQSRFEATRTRVGPTVIAALYTGGLYT